MNIMTSLNVILNRVQKSNQMKESRIGVRYAQCQKEQITKNTATMEDMIRVGMIV